MRLYHYDTKDKEPEFFTVNKLSTKEDVLVNLDLLEKEVLHNIETNAHHTNHTISYYRAMEAQFEKLRQEIKANPIPRLTEDWWYYSIMLNTNSIYLQMNHLAELKFSVNTNERGTFLKDLNYSSDGKYKFIKIDFKRLSIDGYAAKYEVEPVTVRQWIRRGKLRTAIREGREWKIPELTDLPQRGVGEAKYSAELKKTTPIPEAYAYLENSYRIQIEPRDDNMFRISVFIKGEKLPTVIYMTDAERAKFEMFLMGSPDYTYCVGLARTTMKNNESIFGVILKITESGELEQFGEKYDE